MSLPHSCSRSCVIIVQRIHLKQSGCIDHNGFFHQKEMLKVPFATTKMIYQLLDDYNHGKRIVKNDASQQTTSATKTSAMVDQPIVLTTKIGRKMKRCNELITHGQETKTEPQCGRKGRQGTISAVLEGVM